MEIKAQQTALKTEASAMKSQRPTSEQAASTDSAVASKKKQQNLIE